MKLQRMIKRTLKILAAFTIFHMGISALNYAYEEVIPWYQILWHHYDESKGTIDNLYLGSSHVYCDIYPQQLDRLNGQSNFNLSSPMQLLNGSYYLLREADADNTLSHIYLELYYFCSSKDNFNEDLEPVESNEFYLRNWLHTDFMPPSVNRLAYMLSIGPPDAYADILFPFVRYRSKLDNWDYVKENTEEKRTESFKSYSYHYDHQDGNGYDEYWKQGYFYSSRQSKDQDRLFEQSRILTENSLGEQSEYWLRKIIEYCQRKNLPLTLFISPIDELQLVSTENYDNYVCQIKTIANEYDLDFYDFNLAKEEYLPIQSGTCFRDLGHLNYTGASMFTPFFYKVISGNAKDNADYFYDSYAEKLRETPPALYGLYYRDCNEIRTFHIASNRSQEMEYRIIITPEEGEQYCLQDFHTNTIFTLPTTSHGVCTIVARMADTPEQIVRTLEINF